LPVAHPQLTLIVNRLERLGLAQRRAVPEDRRVRHVVLTRRGVKTRADLQEAMYRPPDEIVTLDREVLETPDAALKPLAGEGGSPTPPGGRQAPGGTIRS